MASRTAGSRPLGCRVERRSAKSSGSSNVRICIGVLKRVKWHIVLQYSASPHTGIADYHGTLLQIWRGCYKKGPNGGSLVGAA